MIKPFLATGLLVTIFVGALTNDAAAVTKHRQVKHQKASHHAAASHHKYAALKKSKHAKRPVEASRKQEPAVAPAATQVAPSLAGDPAVVKQAIGLVRKSQFREATSLESAIVDPVARKLVEWFVLRSTSETSFERYAAFIAENPNWPVRLLRARAEDRLWRQPHDAATVKYFTSDQPVSAKGTLALARILLNEGDREGAERRLRETWQSAELSERTETEVLAAFPGILTRDDHRARMDKRIGAKDFAGAMRAAQRLGSSDTLIAKACVAAMGGASKAPRLLDAVPSESRQDLGYTLCQIQWATLHDRVPEATRLMLAAPTTTMTLQDTDEWWRARRVLARKLLDAGDPQNAYEVVRGAALPANESYRAEFHFMPGWIALRFLNDPATALVHFARIDIGSDNPIVQARASYWRARAAEAIGATGQMRSYYEAAARHATSYYGQLARTKLGLDAIELRSPPKSENPSTPISDELVHAAGVLYDVGERDVVLAFANELAERCEDPRILVALAELAGRRDDARVMLQIGKTALVRGQALDTYAFPTIGLPQHRQVGPEIDRSVVYSVARTESAFDQNDISPAKAVGLMQVTPAAGRDTAKRVGVAYDWQKLVSDPVYNVQMGSAELAALLREYRGSYIMTFAGYNAGRGRVQQWTRKYGDPRDPKVDPVDWVERIPFAETRNYVQRVMENVQVYRARFSNETRVISELERLQAIAPSSNGVR